MEGKFEVTTTIQAWEPPFNKDNTTIEYIGEIGEEFDEDKSIKSNVFKILKLTPSFAILSFHHQYTLKRSQLSNFDLLISPKELKIPKGVSVELSFMWGNRGTTKTIIYEGLEGGTKDE